MSLISVGDYDTYVISIVNSAFMGKVQTCMCPGVSAMVRS